MTDCNLTSTNETKNMQRNQAWLNLVSKNAHLCGAINVLVQEDFARKYSTALSSNILLETLMLALALRFWQKILTLTIRNSYCFLNMR